ncbi:nucleotide-binding-oligomerization-domain like receptor [Pyrrhoderma noxium]|uniref:Nucleotide-binding-oligomerization-domain like receptor n=1 Tax=Pyrrhoderma noxium TaxID=2282107 RepID=A0A286UI92_9AGAM|nr:nucleotide-binding-oligomerization-domain like receptor [Pyrrhoderma noxium]
MPVNQSGDYSTTNIETHNELGTSQYNLSLNADNPTINVHLNGPANKIIIEPDMQKLKEILKPMTVPEQEANRPKCLDGTRVDLLQKIREWASSSDSPNIFLLIGIAGTGKSTVARTIAEQFEKEGRLGCYIYFERGKTDPSTITSTVIRTIAYHLARNNSIVAKSISEVTNSDRLSTFPSINILFQDLLHDPLLKGVSGQILVVLDALDECGSSDAQEELVNLFKEKVTKLPSSFRLLVTTRPESSIRSLFLSSTPSICEYFNLDHTSISSREDVLKFIRHEMKELREKRDWNVPDDWPWDEKMEELGEAADGIFIWAAIAIKYISRKKPCQFEDLKILVDNLWMVNKSLSGLYTTVLEGSLDWDDVTKKRFSRIFSLILFGKRQLTVKEIDEFLEMPIGTTRSLLSYIQSLVTYEEGKPIRIHHASLYDYLISSESVGLAWHIDEEKQKNNIVRWCFNQMRKRLRFNICDLETSFAMNKDVVQYEERVQNNIPTSLLYACQNWALHLRDVPYLEELSDSLHYFAYNSLLYWVEVLSLTGCLYTCLGLALEIAIKWVDVKGSRLSIFLEDARNQLIKFNEPLSQSTPHLYMTLLPLMKEEDSIVARHYAARFGGLTRVEYNGDKPRPACIKQIDVGSAVYSVSYSPDGKYAVSGSGENVCVWDVVNGGLVFGPFKGMSISVTFSNDGKYISSGNADGTISVWNAATGEGIHVALEGHTEQVNSVAFSPDSRYIASGSNDRTVQIWDVEKGIAIGEPLQGNSGGVRFVIFSPNGIHFASSSYYEIIVWYVESREMVHQPLESNLGSSSIMFSHDSSKIISGYLPGAVHIWDVSEGTKLREISVSGIGDGHLLACSPDGRHILVGCGDRIMRIWDAEDSEMLPKLFRGHTNMVTSASFSPDGTRFVSGSLDGTIRIWDVVGGQIETNPSCRLTAMAVSVDGKYLVTGSEDGIVTVWSVETGEVLKGPLEGHRVTSLSFSPVPDEYRFASGSVDNTVRIWKLNGESIACHGHTGSVRSVCFSPDGIYVASGSQDRTIRVWKSQSGALCISPLEGHLRCVNSVCYAPDGTRIVSGSDDETVRIWDSSNGNLLFTLGGHSDLVSRVAYSHNGSIIISGGYRKTIVWDAKSKNLARELKGTSNRAESICFSSDDAWVAFSHGNGSISIWNTITDSLLLKTSFLAWMSYIAFLPSTDAKYIRLVSASNDGLIRIWCLDIGSQETTWILQNDGWLTGSDGNLLFWVPSDLRSTLTNGACTRILNSQFSTKLLLSENQGTRWTTCHCSPPSPSPILHHPIPRPRQSNCMLAFYAHLIRSPFIRFFFSSE